MANIIADRSGNKVVRMQNSQFARKPAAGFFTDWTTVRVGVLCALENTGGNVGGTPRFGLGICSGLTNIPGNSTVTNFVGLISNDATWSFQLAGGNNYQAIVNTAAVGFAATKYVNTTITYGGLIGGNGATFAMRIVLAAMYIVEITKGSPNYSIRLFTPISSDPVVSEATFDTAMLAATPTVTNHTWWGAQTIATDESAGAFDAGCVWWNQATPYMDILKWSMVKVA